jgi:pimeloyl-ACP methyl ester carboxylesterase
MNSAVPLHAEPPVTETERPEIGMTLEAGGFKTNYLDSGDGPAVVLVHGSGPGVTGYANWRLNMPVLAERYRVIAPDMAGFGYSARPTASFATSTYGRTRSSASSTRWAFRVRRLSAIASVERSPSASPRGTPGASTSWC